MIKLQTPVIDEKNIVDISYDDKILIIGSCFADNIGKKMKDMGFNVCHNPFGTLYNPVSIYNSLKRLACPSPFRPEDVIQMGSGSDKYCSFTHHTSFARLSPEEFLSNANAQLEQAAAFFQKANKIIITLGTSWCYKHEESGKTVSNCLKRNASEFSRYRLEVDEIVELFEGFFMACDKQAILTVSPIRHLKDGARGNAVSKATLLAAADKLCQGLEGCDYFPSYEIMMDELRDYRFYSEDMTHPSEQAVNYIWERFHTWALRNGEQEQLKAAEKTYRRSQHREFFK